MLYKYIISLLTIAYLATSCTDKLIEIPIPYEAPKLVISATWCKDCGQADSLLRVWVGSTTTYATPATLDSSGTFLLSQYYGAIDYARTYSGTAWVSNATVELYRNGQLYKTFAPDANRRAYLTDITADSLEEGATYELRVQAPDFEPCISTQTIPTNQSAISNITRAINGGRDQDGNLYDVIEFDIQATSSMQQYYESAVLVIDSMLYGGSYWTHATSPMPSITGSNRGIALNKDLFGTNSTLHITYWTNPVDDSASCCPRRLVFYMYLLSPAQYFFDRSLSDFQNAQDDPFAEPVMLYSNITGGRGLFSINRVIHEQIIH